MSKRRHSPGWERARAERKARRAKDPHVQHRAEARERRLDADASVSHRLANAQAESLKTKRPRRAPTVKAAPVQTAVVSSALVGPVATTNPAVEVTGTVTTPETTPVQTSKPTKATAKKATKAPAAKATKAPVKAVADVPVGAGQRGAAKATKKAAPAKKATATKKAPAKKAVAKKTSAA